MSIQTTITQLRELGLHGMAEAFESMMRLPLQKRPGLERAVEKMIQTELCIRDRRLAEKLLKTAKLRYKVFIEDITCSVERNLTEGRLAEVADCNFIRRGENLLITGLTGCGKSYLACALGYQACTLGLSTLFLSMNHFADELTKARLEGTYQKLIRKLGKKDLLYSTTLACSHSRLRHVWLYLPCWRIGMRRNLSSSRHSCRSTDGMTILPSRLLPTPSWTGSSTHRSISSLKVRLCAITEDANNITSIC